MAADGVAADQVKALIAAAQAAGASAEVVGTHLGNLTGADGSAVPVDKTLANTASVLFDAVFVPGGAQSLATLVKMGDARAFVEEAYKHAKTIGASGEGADLLAASQLGQLLGLKAGVKLAQAQAGVVLDSAASSQQGFKTFLEAMAQHRHWGRDLAVQVAV